MHVPGSFLRWSALAVCAITLTTPTRFVAAQSGANSGKAAAGKNLSLHFDSAGTQIHFTLKGLLRNVRGSFPLKGGALAVDPESGLAQGEILVDAGAGRTGNKATENRLKQVLDTDRYPAIFFHAERLNGNFPEGDGAADLTADGTLNIHGADHPMQLKVHVERHGSGVAMTTHFIVPYVAWGMPDASTTLTRYSKQVEVDVDAKASVEAVKTKQANAEGASGS